ncbi:MAG TPA: imidazole glycerol phosphate synthase subunit HisH [Bacteroidales bacterium]|jgi:glutamine amidotransferase|nr:imidazole glycerol phosphate synthase subunit HisH [Bacteroidales bacterium]OQB60425.1 MAG: Imidazole glycerol phosphate synthase subunit HisH [Bacteroidetes bacterium ADurb.Bin145]NMD03804.1 imidazole glycerol phosphate synthase subunit HisH [Bacteroidales bacterium]HOU03182.1 imidazole glycerol phosphate synthase subunit HisH [Bacteroidales bacterium]HQG63482.1 imidazole glycerol phosphate synthase subunit HisH [Bacteroidales bacterium]
MIAIIKYNAGNIKSVQNALDRLGFESVITDDNEIIRKADKVIFPGVGEAGSAMRYLSDKGLDRLIRSLNQPVLGICLGLQLMCSHSEESDAKCLGIFDSQVRMFPLTDKVPHMGWNNLSSVKGELFKGFPLTGNVYFVHSYYAEVSIDTSAVCEYILPFSAAMQKDNFYATQFHPEKSASEGEIILRNFLGL